MIEGTNGAIGIDVVREDDIIRFIGHFKEEIISEMVVSVVDAKTMFDSTGTTELNRDGKPVGLIGYEPQGTSFFFLPNQGYDLICVDSSELKKAVEEAIRV